MLLNASPGKRKYNAENDIIVRNIMDPGWLKAARSAYNYWTDYVDPTHETYRHWEKGEFLLPGSNYIGPGTPTKIAKKYMPATTVDAFADVHDDQYSEAKMLANGNPDLEMQLTADADVEMFKNVYFMNAESEFEAFQRRVALLGIGAKIVAQYLVPGAIGSSVSNHFGKDSGISYNYDELVKKAKKAYPDYDPNRYRSTRGSGGLKLRKDKSNINEYNAEESSTSQVAGKSSGRVEISEVESQHLPQNDVEGSGVIVYDDMYDPENEDPIQFAALWSKPSNSQYSKNQGQGEANATDTTEAEDPSNVAPYQQEQQLGGEEKEGSNTNEDDAVYDNSNAPSESNSDTIMRTFQMEQGQSSLETLQSVSQQMKEQDTLDASSNFRAYIPGRGLQSEMDRYDTGGTTAFQVDDDGFNFTGMGGTPNQGFNIGTQPRPKSFYDPSEGSMKTFQGGTKWIFYCYNCLNATSINVLMSLLGFDATFNQGMLQEALIETNVGELSGRICRGYMEYVVDIPMEHVKRQLQLAGFEEDVQVAATKWMMDEVEAMEFRRDGSLTMKCHRFAKNHC